MVIDLGSFQQITVGASGVAHVGGGVRLGVIIALLIILPSVSLGSSWQSSQKCRAQRLGRGVMRKVRDLLRLHGNEDCVVMSERVRETRDDAKEDGGAEKGDGVGEEDERNAINKQDKQVSGEDTTGGDNVTVDDQREVAMTGRVADVTGA